MATVLLFCLLACFVGIGIAVFGSSNSMIALVIIGIMFVAAIGLIWVYDIQIGAFTRFLFVFSFFFKGDLNFMKINEVEDPSGLNISLTFVLALLLFLIDLYDSENESNLNVFPAAFSIVLSGLILCAFLSAFYGASGLLGWFSFASFMSGCFICYVAASHFSRRERLVEFVTAIAAGLCFTGLTSISQYLLDYPKMPFFGTGTDAELAGTQSIQFSRVSAFLRTPTEMGWIISALIPLTLTPLISKVENFNLRNKILLMTGTGLAIAAVILSLARGSWISLLLGVLIIISLGWVKLSKNEKGNYFKTVGVFALVAIIALVPFSERIYDRLTTDDGDSAASRVYLMENAWEMIKDNTLVGVGLSSYREVSPKYDETSVHISQTFPNPVHNLFLHITTETGIPAGILFCLLFVIGAAVCFEIMTGKDKMLYALALAGLVALIAFAISAMKEPGSLGSVRPPLRTLFLLFGFIFAVNNCRKREKKYR